MKILIVEDDAEAAAFLAAGLAERGHEATVCANGPDALEAGLGFEFDVLVLDRMIPGLDGLTLLKTLRERGVATPALFLSHLSGIDDRVEGLEAGGDDYLVKPYAFSELMARLNALARRPRAGAEPTELTVADLEMNLLRRTVKRRGELIDLQPREFQLLECLIRAEGRVLTRTMLLEKVWHFHFDPQTNIVETQMSRLRAKVDRGHAVQLIQTLRGAGYFLRAPD
jgi:two-component system, OmpR family, response regulator